MIVIETHIAIHIETHTEHMNRSIESSRKKQGKAKLAYFEKERNLWF